MTGLTACNIQNDPEILNIRAEPNPVYAGEISELSCEAVSSYLGEVDYAWFCSEGEIMGFNTKQNISWIAPAEPGVYIVSVEVSNGISKASEDLEITVILNEIEYLFNPDSLDWNSNALLIGD